jgi:endonuclease YncB( thermonuclease family)
MRRCGGWQAQMLMLLSLALWLTPGCAGSSQQPSGTVVAVGDGDSISVRQGKTLMRVRLACIDAPEQGQFPYGQRAREALLRQLPIGSQVALHVKDIDRYGRTVAEVYHRKRNINLAMVEAGQAFAYRRHLPRCQGEAYLAAERGARQRGGGIWQGPDGILRPWAFRKQQPARANGANRDVGAGVGR